MAAMFAAQTMEAGVSRQQYSMPPCRSPGPRATLTHSGRWPGQRFSKKPLVSVPFGKRLNVSARPRKCGSAYGAMRA